MATSPKQAQPIIKEDSPHLVFSPAYNTDLPAFGLNKPFALDRGELVLAQLQKELKTMPTVLSPEPLHRDDLLLVHSPEYLQSLEDEATWLEIFELKKTDLNLATATRKLPELINDFMLKSGGTLLAARQALKVGLAANLGGGYHHAQPHQGRGFCVINDTAIAIAKLQAEKLIEKALIIDLDFHQGDGNAVSFAGDDTVFTLSVHSEEGWPEDKKVSDLDIAIKEADKGSYLERTKAGVETAFRSIQPDLVMFIAGSDAYEKDVLPGTKFLRLPLEVMQARDEFVIDSCKSHNVPMIMVFAGGYGPHVWEVHHLAVRHLLLRSGFQLKTMVQCESKSC